MDEKRSNRGQRLSNDNAGYKGVGTGYQPMRDAGSKSSQGSHSKFNRILGNLERSILNQFNSTSNQSDKHRHHSVQKQTRAKVRPAINDGTNVTTSTMNVQHACEEGREHSNGCKSVKHQTSNQVQEQSTSQDNIASSLKASVVKSASEKLGKLTLNSKSQLQHKSPRQHQQLLSSSLRPNTSNLATNKIPIPPPPHAHSEARGLNQAFLFGNETTQPTMLSADHRLSLDTNSAKTNASCSILKQELGTGKMRSDRLFEELNANRLNSSPASSAKSLPTIVPKSGSQSSNPLTGANQDEEEESGFATYQSRRSAILKSQQHQQQLDFSRATGEDRNNTMMYHQLANQHSNFHTTARPHNTTISHQMHNNQNRSNLAFNHMIQHNNNLASSVMMPQTNPRQYTQPHMVSQNDQPATRDPFNNFRYHSYNQLSQPNNMIFSQNRESQQLQGTVPFQQTAYIDHRLAPQRVLNQQISSDNGQQIYANAPPKPRRYQYYEVMTSQTSVPMGQVARFNMAMMNQPPTMPSMQQHHPTTTTTIRSIPDQQTSYHQRQNVMPQLAYQPVIAGAPSLNNLSRLTLSNVNKDILTRLNQPLNNPSGMQPRQQVQDSVPGHHMGFPLVKSKSSLDAGDIMRFRQGPQVNSQQNPPNLQLQPKQPYYGYQNEGSLHRNINQPNMRPLSYDHQPSTIIGGNLQRSKSVTHLLPEIDESAYQSEAPISVQRMAPVSSASTNHLNHVGTNQVIAPPMTHNRVHQTIGTASRPPIQQHLQRAQLSSQQNQGSNYCIERNSLAHDLNANSISNQSQFHKARSVAALNSELASSNSRLIRCSPGNVPYDWRGSNKPSLGDQIKHLLIGGADNISARTSGACNQDDNAIYQAFEHNRSFGLVPSSSDASSFSQPSTTWARSNGDCGVQVTKVQQHQQQQQQQQRSQHIQQTQYSSSNRSAIENERFNIIRNTSNANSYTGNQASQNSPSNGQVSASSLSLAEVNEFADMGNRQQRQYQVQQPNGASDVRNRTMNSSRRPIDTNSHLIVDLTTPKVLAKTQTTLQPANNSIEHSADSWSINQVGLPQMSGPPSVPTTSSAARNGDRLSFPVMDSSNTNQRENTDKQGDRLFIDKATTDGLNINSSSLERTAPYYYSDLKSEEQRQALMSIVQQKSLSPPPQLLSRSTDQSATRLTSRSATMHSSHARTLSDSLAQRRREQNDIVDSATTSTKNGQSRLNDADSTSDIADNIDKLFDRSFDDQNTNGSKAARSMLTLSSDKESKDLSHLSLDQTSRGANTESISSGYCSSELRSKNISKSKSLDNISQKLIEDDSASSGNSINPVYENIRCSNKLLSAITDIGETFATDKSSNIKSLTATNGNSDSSMDSILGSSLDDSDSCSDIIDEIKVSSTDNHLNDISDLIEQLKANHSKLTEEYKSTLVRIAKTINSKNKQAEMRSSEKMARRLNLLEMKSKKCESRSKNQLALIQMMEKVLRQSKLRAMSNRSSVTSTVGDNVVSGQSLPELASVVTAVSSSQGLDHLGRSSAIGHNKTTSTNKAQDASGQDNSSNQRPMSEKNVREQIKSISPSDGSRRGSTTKAPAQEIIRAIVVEKQTSSTEFVKPNANLLTSQSETASNSNQSRVTSRDNKDNDGGEISKSTMNNAVSKRILDIEARNSNVQQQAPRLDNKTNPFCDNFTDGESGQNSSKTSMLSRQHKRYIDQSIDEDDDDSLRDDEDFIEFLSNGSSSHRSTFEASQFSASDFNTSTSTSESSNSCGANGDSLNSMLFCKKNSANKNQFKSNGSNSSATVGILKSSNGSCNYDNANDNSDNVSNGGLAKGANDEKSNSPTLCDATRAKGNRLREAEKFKNVLGNVIDVDSCSVNNLPGTSPVNTHQTPCV